MAPGIAVRPVVHECIRVDQSRRIRRVLVRGATLMVLGAMVIAVSLVTRQARGVQAVAAVAGFVLTVTAALGTVFSLSQALRDEAYIAVRSDGLMMLTRGAESFVAWGDLERVAVDEDGSGILIHRREGEPLFSDSPFGGMTPKALSAHLESMRRKAAFSLLR